MADVAGEIGSSPALRAKPRLAPFLLPVLLFVALALAPLLANAAGSGYLVGLLSRVVILAIAAVSLDLILGYGAMVSFGHAAFLGIGAYAVGIAQTHGLVEAAVVIPLAMAASAVFALATGAVAVRTDGVHFIMITLAFGQMAYFTATSLAQYGGDDGLTLQGRSELFGSGVLGDRLTFYYACLACLALAYALCRCVVASRFGRVLRAAMENPGRTASLGFAVARVRLVAYVMAGALCGLAGALLANQTEFVSPAYMSWQRSGELIFMVVLGGLGSLHGAIIGALAFLLLEEWLSGLTEHWKMVFGPLLVLVVLFARGGLLGLLKARTS